MKKFMDKDFLLTTDTAKHLYHDFSENLPIIDACFQSGFNCEGYFYKEFKKMYSMTPKQMLKMKETTE